MANRSRAVGRRPCCGGCDQRHTDSTAGKPDFPRDRRLPPRWWCDLLLVSADGHQAVVRDYFTLADPAGLIAGASHIDAATVRALAGPHAPAQYAQAADGSAQQPIGRVETIAGDSVVLRSNGTQEALSPQSLIFAGDVVQTTASGQIGLVLADDTAFTLGAGTRLAIVDFAFDAATGIGSASFTATNGVLAVVGGRIATGDSDAMTLTTPVASIAIRGEAVLAISLAPNAPATVTLIRGGPEASVGVTAGGVNTTLDQTRETIEIGGGAISGDTVILTNGQADALFGDTISGFPAIAQTADFLTTPTAFDDAAPFAFQSAFQSLALTNLPQNNLVARSIDEARLSFLSPLPANSSGENGATSLLSGALIVPPAIALPDFSIADVLVSEGEAFATFTVSRAGNLSVSSLVNLSTASGTATAGTDFVQKSNLILFDPGIPAQTFSVALTDDSLVEGSETFGVSLDVLINGIAIDGVASATLVDDDMLPEVSLTGGSALESAGSIAFTITRSGNLGIASSVEFSTSDSTALAPSDYTAIFGQTVTFAIGITSQIVNVNVIDETEIESDETVIGVLSGASDVTIAATTASATILNDDAGFSIADLLVIEGIGTASVTITRSGNLTQASSVTLSTAGGTATSGADFTAISNQLISFGIGVATQTVAVAITNDGDAETSEAFFCEPVGSDKRNDSRRAGDRDSS